jgi:hypothetical protein
MDSGSCTEALISPESTAADGRSRQPFAAMKIDRPNPVR